MEKIRSGLSRGQSLGDDSRLNGETIVGLPPDVSPVGIKTGFSPEKLPEFAYPGLHGTIRAEMPEIGRIEIDLDPATESGSNWSGFLIVGKELRPLPIGSTFDSAAGVFIWQAGPGFIGTYDLVFIRDGSSKKPVTIIVGPNTVKKEPMEE